MAKTLELTFLSDMGKPSKLTIDNPKEPIDPIAVKAAMDQIIAANAFDGNGGDFVQAQGARLLERNVTEYELV
ncbi:DUF2922 domain-containing protein [Bacillus sp. ISL-47]|uniref:DUF2922 domain-containing protein n=1 Tax=Bacillus sp. ISL-47 TaxID=2819130 RepID=UPI001BE85C6A|nr:DUF2922 domain-containing protein [Bacillus sp. ISL-47]MBT2686609.1 DUF2922 domain-containing protein [Bacillus sp. ISL-47]MBT2707001.1 DUF2922 domain-containing protein [Pseudomonas sp. ISL-84]